MFIEMNLNKFCNRVLFFQELLEPGADFGHKVVKFLSPRDDDF